MERFKSYDELPLTLDAKDINKFLGVSPTSCYSLFILIPLTLIDKVYQSLADGVGVRDCMRRDLNALRSNQRMTQSAALKTPMVYWGFED